MSFSYAAKKEICEGIDTDGKKYAFFYGMILFCRRFTPENIVFRTENDIACDMFTRLADDVIGVKDAASVEEMPKENVTLYTVSIPEESVREELIHRYHIYSRSVIHRIQDDIITDENAAAFLAGAFISCGSMTEPIKEYHLEFVVPFPELAYDLLEMLVDIGVNAKISERKNDHIIYLKESESIEDLLTYMGAPGSSVELMNVKIYKDIRNKTNRITNCDNANIERTLKASRRQVADIEYIERTIGLDSLSDDLRNIAELRLENPEISLKELGGMLDKPLGRSGANHRLKKLTELAEKLRAGGERGAPAGMTRSE